MISVRGGILTHVSNVVDVGHFRFRSFMYFRTSGNRLGRFLLSFLLPS